MLQTDRTFALGLGLNSGLAVAKLAVGWWAGSPALTADGWHSLSDVLTNAGAWGSHRWARVPPDEDHHFGHGNAEAVAGMGIGLVLLAGGLGISWEAVQGGHGSSSGVQGSAALAMAVVSVGVNYWLARVTARAAVSSRSSALRALASDNRSDVLTALLVIAGVLASLLGFPALEPWVAAAIGLYISWIGLQSAREGFDVLMDRVPDTELRERIAATAAAVAGVAAVGPCRIHPLGASMRVELDISVDGSLTVDEGHRIAHRVERAVVAAHPPIGEVHVHVNPAGAAGGRAL